MQKEVRHPTGRIKAVLFSKEAGATVPNSYQLSIMTSGNQLSDLDVGNVFSLRVNTLGRDSIPFEWKGNDSLWIYVPSKAEYFIHNSSVEGIDIVYKTK